MDQCSEDKLITKKLKEGDVIAFDAIFNKYHKKVYYFAYSYLKSKEEAEDVVQEVFFNLWKCRHQINEYYVFSKYLFKITYNETCKKFRKQASDKKQLDMVLQSVPKEDSSTNLEIEYNNLLETANLLIAKLPTRQKEILLLSINEHLENEQIANKLHISQKSVSNYLTRAKSSLRKSLADGRLLTILYFWLFLK